MTSKVVTCTEMWKHMNILTMISSYSYSKQRSRGHAWNQIFAYWPRGLLMLFLRKWAHKDLIIAKEACGANMREAHSTASNVLLGPVEPLTSGLSSSRGPPRSIHPSGVTFTDHPPFTPPFLLSSLAPSTEAGRVSHSADEETEFGNLGYKCSHQGLLTPARLAWSLAAVWGLRVNWPTGC